MSTHVCMHACMLSHTCNTSTTTHSQAHGGEPLRLHRETHSCTQRGRQREKRSISFCPLNVVIHGVCDLRPKHSSIHCWQVGYIYGTNDGEPSSTYLNERPQQNAVFLCAISFTRTGNTRSLPFRSNLKEYSYISKHKGH